MLTVVLSLTLIAVAVGAALTLGHAVLVVIPRIGDLRSAATSTAAVRVFAVRTTGHRVSAAQGIIVAMAGRGTRASIRSLNGLRAAA